MFIEIDPAPSQGAAGGANARQSHQPDSVPGGSYLRFRNDHGVREICIGVKHAEPKVAESGFWMIHGEYQMIHGMSG
jgi:hypothetical protein